MSTRQARSPRDDPPAAETGRAAQRRRTRASIVAATTRLVAAGETPSVDEIAAAADVSRRTVYMYFPTLDQLLLDATVGALSASAVDKTLATKGDPDDPAARVDALVRTVTKSADVTLPLGRKIIALTVDAPPPPATDVSTARKDGRTDNPRRGYRRLDWIRSAVEPLQHDLTAEQMERLVAALSVVVGWEAMVVLRDVDGLGPRREEQVLRWAARALVDAMAAEVAGP